MKANLFLFMATTLLFAGSAQAETGEDMLAKASASFSALPFDTAEEAVPGSFKKLPDDEGDGTATYADANQVQHYFWKDCGDQPSCSSLLVVKIVETKDFANRPISALNIGKARSRADVLAKVRAFMPQAEVDCREAGDAGEGEGIASCGAMLGEGWIKLLFDKDNQLTVARIDAYEFT